MTESNQTPPHYDVAAELIRLTGWIGQQLNDETASRQLVCEDALARIHAIVEALRAAQEAAARRAAAMPPVTGEAHADALPAVVAACQAYAADPGPARMFPHSHRILTEALADAGVTVGVFDHFIVDWLAAVNVSTCAIVAGWVTRAAAAAVLPAGQAGTQTGGEAEQ